MAKKRHTPREVEIGDLLTVRDVLDRLVAIEPEKEVRERPIEPVRTEPNQR